MSTLVVCRGLKRIWGEVDAVPVRDLARGGSYMEALENWGVAEPAEWLAVLSWRGQLWDDLLNAAVGDSEARQCFVDALGRLARACDEVAIWYAGFPDDMPVTHNPAEFENAVVAQIQAGELEPAVRMRRP